MSVKTSMLFAAALLLSAGVAHSQADLGPRTPVEGGAIIMPEQGAQPKKEERREERPAPTGTTPHEGKSQPPGPGKSKQDDCKGKQAHCKQDSAR